MIRILVADDDRGIRRLIGRALSDEAEMSVVGEATSGWEAVELAARLNPDVVVMDYELPGIDGLQAAARILRQRPGQVIVLCSGALTPDVRSAAEAIGVSACLDKIDLAELATTLRTLVS